MQCTNRKWLSPWAVQYVIKIWHIKIIQQSTLKYHSHILTNTNLKNNEQRKQEAEEYGYGTILFYEQKVQKQATINDDSIRATYMVRQ